MNIIMPTFERIEWMPPTITLINELVALGHSVNYITIYQDEYYNEFDQNKVKNTFLFKNFPIQNEYGQIKPLMGLASRGSKIAKFIISTKLKQTLKKQLKKGDVLWVVNELTVMYAGYKFLKKYSGSYIFSIYELHTKRRSSIAKAAQNAAVTVVPEYNRAQMQRAFYDLKMLPLVLPNKPDYHPMQRHMYIEDERIRGIIDGIVKSGKKIVLYMGIITEERPLDRFIDAISEIKDSFQFVAIGRGNEYVKKLKSKYPNDFTYLGYMIPPQHLQVASWADIGLLVYVSDNNKNGLNALYCAPNKIYEYAGFGMPMIVNDIPGLYYTVQYNKCGYCVDMDNTQDIIDKLRLCVDNHGWLSKNAKEFYDSIDITSEIENILNRFNERICAESLD